MNARMDEKGFAEPDRYDAISDERLQGLILDDMLDSIMGLHSVRSRFDRLELAYASRPTDVRVEIIDSIAYVSPFVRNRSRGNKYPEVFRYDSRSVPAEVAALEFDREFGLLSGASLRFADVSRSDLWRHFSRKGWDLSDDQFEQRY